MRFFFVTSSGVALATIYWIVSNKLGLANPSRLPIAVIAAVTVWLLRPYIEKFCANLARWMTGS